MTLTRNIVKQRSLVLEFVMPTKLMKLGLQARTILAQILIKNARIMAATIKRAKQ